MKKNIAVIILILFVSLAAAQTPPDLHIKINPQQKQEQPDDQQSGFKAKYVFLSLILPGAGEWFMGHKSMGKFFLGTEFVMWAGYFGTRAYGDVLQRDLESYAAVHAGVDVSGKKDQYWIDIGSAENIYLYNEQQRVDRNLAATYKETTYNYWQWDSKGNRSRYNNLRVEQHDWKRRATFMVSGLILNRIVSAIDVVRIISKEKREARERMSRLYFDYRRTPMQGEALCLNMRLRW